MVGVWLGMKNSSVLWRQLGLGADRSVDYMSWLSVLCSYGGSVLFEPWSSVLCGCGNTSWRQSVDW